VTTGAILSRPAGRYENVTAHGAPALVSSYRPGDLLDYAFDQRYVEALRDRDQAAESHLISVFSGPVRCKLRTLLRSPELVQDASQETFLRVLSYFRSGKTLDNPANLSGFVLSVCQNIGLEYLRAYTRHDQMPMNLPEQVDRRMNPEEGAVDRERRDLVRQFVFELPEKDRDLLRRVFLEEEDKDQVCAEMKVTRQYLRVLLYRARVRLRTALERAALAAEKIGVKRNDAASGCTY
jgi:RNA polymerase sigma-70 factor (ECF subfamily)